MFFPPHFLLSVPESEEEEDSDSEDLSFVQDSVVFDSDVNLSDIEEPCSSSLHLRSLACSPKGSRFDLKIYIFFPLFFTFFLF